MRMTSHIVFAAAALAAATTMATAKDWTTTTIRIGTDATYPPARSSASTSTSATRFAPKRS